MSWVTITVDLLHEKQLGAEVDAAQTVALAEGKPDPVPGIIAEVIREVRGYVVANPKNKPGPEGTVPDELLGQAINRIRFEAATRVPGGALMDEDRRTANRDAWSAMRDASAGRMAIAQPDTVSEEVIAGGSVYVAKCTRLSASRRKTDGL
jgi:hypothetical protein